MNKERHVGGRVQGAYGEPYVDGCVGTWGVYILTPTLLDVDANLGVMETVWATFLALPGVLFWLHVSVFFSSDRHCAVVLEVSGGVRGVCDGFPLAHGDSSGWRRDSVSLWGGCVLGRKIWTWCSQHFSSCLFGWTSYSICLCTKPAGNLRIVLECVWDRLLSIHHCSLLLSVSVPWCCVLLLLSRRSLST